MQFYDQYAVSPDDVQGKTIVVRDREAFHAVKVKRKHTGDDLVVVDGRGTRYFGIIAAIEKDQLILEIRAQENLVNEPLLQVTLAQAVPKGQGFDWLIEKGTEIGIRRFVPLLTRRSVVEPSARIERWQKKAIAAMKQCGGSVVPAIEKPVRLEQFLDGHSVLTLIAHEGFETRLDADIPQLLKKHRAVTLLVGPEGGFEEQEVSYALEKGAMPLSLGQRRLRSETAGLVAATKLFVGTGDI